MPDFGIYSDHQNERSGSVLYINLQGQEVAVTEIDKFNTQEETLDCFANGYLKRCSDGVHVGQITEYVRRIEISNWHSEIID